jgi:hypothetical protein
MTASPSFEKGSGGSGAVDHKLNLLATWFERGLKAARPSHL